MMLDPKYLIILAIFVLFERSNAVSRVDPLVSTNVGLIRGVQAIDGEYSMFMGIPYARVDEVNPFGPSAPYPQFEGIFEAYDDTAICPQSPSAMNPQLPSIGKLDCLHLNIYVPNSANSINKLPVLVFIHGGAFRNGFAVRSTYGPKYLVKQNIILVTLNYRLGPYGFMCLNNPRVPGNQGLKDQLTALRWINENIEAFGGDVTKITISGESAGSASVDLHLLSEHEKLFDKVILQSGTGLSPWAITEPDSSAPLKLSARFDFETDDINEALSHLSTVDAKMVVTAAEELGLEFFPCVERDFEGVEKFISTNPINARAPNIRTTAILIGSNDNELLYTYGNMDLGTLGNLFYQRLETTFDFENNELYDLDEILRHFYIGDDDITNNVKQSVIDFDSDFQFHHPTARSIRKYVENGARSVFRYVFSYDGGRNYLKQMYNVTGPGASHADELGYLFDISSYTESPSIDDQLMIDRITTLWANFVKYGDPTPEVSDLLPVKWNPVTGDKMPYLNFNSELSLKGRPFKERSTFWDLFYETYGKLQKGYSENDGA